MKHAAQRLMAALVAAGGHRLQLGIAWHSPIWLGRARPRRVVDSGVRATPGFYRFEQQKKRARRHIRAQALAKG